MSDPAEPGPDLTSARETYAPTQEEPRAGTAPMGPRDPTEQAGGGAGDMEQLERDSAFYGAGAPAAEPPDAAPFSSGRYPASSQPTGMTRHGDEVTGTDDGPSEGLHDETP